MASPGPDDVSGAAKAPSDGQRATPAPSSQQLGTRATRASVITLGSFVTAQLLRLGGNLILTRLLWEEAFGLMALVQVFLVGLTLFSDMGIGQSLVQSKRGEEPVFQDTAFTTQVVRGVVLWLIACAGAAPFALLYDAPKLRWLLPVTALNSLFLGLTSIHRFTLNRRLSVARQAVLELTSQFLALCAMIAFTFVSRSVWALVCGAVTGSLTTMVLSHVILPGRRARLAWDRESAREMFKFGRWIFLSTALTFLAAQSDRLIFGKLITLRELGIYNIAQMMATMPSTALSRISTAVLFPVFSQAIREGGDVDRTFREVRRPVVLLGGFLISALIAGGPALIELLYDDRFHDAGWMLQLLSIGTWFAVLEYNLMAALLAAGRTRWIAAGSAVKLTVIAALIPIGFVLGGLPGALIGYACSDVARLLVSVAGASSLGIRSWRLDLLVTALVAAAAVAGYSASAVIASQVGSGKLAELARCAGVGLTVGLFWLPLAVPYLKSRLRRGAASA